MPQSEMLTQWDLLQEPRCSTSASTSFLRLLAALDSGWSLSGMVGQRLAQRPDQKDEFCFTLIRSDDGETRTLLLPYSHELTQFIYQEHLVLWQESQAMRAACSSPHSR
jgi:hypothetical protein